MNYEPLPHQLIGKDFLSGSAKALLADAPRVGKTGSAIMAADDIQAARTLVITTASGRPVWVRGFSDWSAYDLATEAVYGKITKAHENADRLIVSWSEVVKHRDALEAMDFDLLILDESHYAKSVEAKRTEAVFGQFNGRLRTPAICDGIPAVWCLTGTPIPNAPNDLYPMLRALAPERLTDDHGPTDVTKYNDFLHRYCVVRQKKINGWTRVDVVVGGKNEAELRDRMQGFWLRRTQQDVGIQAPIFDILPIHISAKDRKQIEATVPDAMDVLAAAETGETKTLEIHLGTLRRVTGTIKASGVAAAVKDEFASGLDKVVLMCWHKDVMEALAKELSAYGVVRLDGSTDPTQRDAAVQSFMHDDSTRVFIGQVLAAGEAIDLSAAAELIFVESSFVPKDMAQAALRITNHGQKRQPRVRVAALEGSVDEAVQNILIRKVATNKEVMR